MSNLFCCLLFILYYLSTNISVKKIRDVVLIVLGLLSCSSTFAEGSKELNPDGGNRVYLFTSTTSTTSLPWANQGLVRVYVQEGETINVGSSVQGLGDGTIILVSPNGNVYTSGTASTTIGRINTRAQEMAGPSPNAGGYTPYTVTAQASEVGVWSVFFVGSNGTNNGTNTPDEELSAEAWDQPNNSPYIAAFDVSIRNVANTAFIPGRAYMNLLEGTLGAFDAKFTGKLNVLTNDGYIYEVNANGLAGNGFAFFSNNTGFKSGGNPSYLSQDGMSTANIHPPLSEDTATDITHKLFFNTPASDLPASAPARTTTGLASNTGSATTTWLKTTPVSPVLTNFSFTGKEGTANQAAVGSTMGGYFGFDANQSGNYNIKIDANKDGDFTDAADRLITDAAIIGTNTVFWDGLDGAGTALTGSFNSSNVQVVLRAGEVHFPLLDVENNPSGIIITRTNGVGSGDQTVYWNDSNISSTTNPSSPLNTAVNGVSSSTNGHKWGSTGYSSGSFGNEKGLDTWTYVFSTPVTPSVAIELLQADLEVLPITKSKTTGICIGQQQTYTVSVRNNGPSGVTDAKFNFTFPAELTSVVVTPVLTSGTASVVSSTIVGSEYNASLNMNSASVLTFTITGTVSSLPAASTLSVEASILRPADVYDADATNPDATIPTDPQSECDSAPSGIGCNNIRTDSTPVLVSNISIAAVSEAEGSGGTHNMAFTVTAATANASCDITLDYAVTHVTTNSADFDGAITGSVTLPAGQTSKTFLIPIETDQIIEADETFTVTISNASSGAVITTATATGTIADDDNISVNKSLVIIPTDGAEGVSPGATFAIGFPTGITADKDTEIEYSLTGTATGGGTDYTGSTTGTVIIPALTNSVTITLPVIDDVILEGTETITITTGTVTTPYTGINVSNSPVSLNIADDDNAILLSGPAQVVEGDNGITYVTFKVSLDITTSSAFTVSYTTQDGTALDSDNDYEAKSGLLAFSGTAGESFEIQIEVNGDKKIEGNEAFKVVLHSLSNTFDDLLTISGSPATISILDDDNNAANKTITITKVDGAEGGAPAEFIFSFPSGVSTDAATTISYTLGGVAIGNGIDYNGLTTGTVTIAAGANSGSFTRTVVDDLIIEDSESVTVTTGTVTNSKYNGIGVSNSPFSLNILDNDNTPANNTITLSAVLDGAEPSSNGQFKVSYPAGIVRSTPTTVNYSIGGTATNGTDYTTLSGSVTIPANTSSATIDIEVTDDQVIEAAETVSLTLTSANSGSVSLNVSPAGAETVNITDNDNVAANNIITLTKVADAEEGLVDGQFKVSFPSGYTSSVPTTVDYVITGTATNGTDYTNLTGQVIIPAGSNSANIDILVSDDLIIETTETISLGLSSATNSISALSVNPLTTVTADLRDNDNIASNSIITLTKVSDGAEPGTNAQFLVSYPAGVTSAAATTVNYFISGTAVNGTDYATLATSVVIPAGDNSAPVNVTVSDDLLIEATETVILTLTTATNSISVPGLTVNPTTGVSADIVDNDNTPANTKIILTKTADGAEPGTKAQFTLSYPAGITNSAATTVNYLVGGTATIGTDYTLPDNTTVIIPANTNSVVIDATVLDDLTIEPTETITIDLITASSSTISTITLEPVGAVSADIADNDNTVANKTITITKVDGVEGMVNGSFTFSFPTGISASAPTEITFYLTGTANGGGTDYTASPSSVSITIPAGQNSVTLPLIVLEDDVIEDTETVTLTTTGITNSELSGIVVGNSPHTLTISDNDDYTTLSVGNATVTEGNSGFVTVTFPVTLEKATGRSFSVKYTTEDGTATTAANDYLSKQDILYFSGLPGESQNVSVQVKGDQVIEMTETFKLRLYDLSDSFGGRLTFANSTATGTITDDDLIPANVKVTITPTNGSETGPVAGIFTFSFPTGVSADAATTVNFGLSGTATGTDFTGAGTSSITIPAGDNSVTLTLPVIDDTLVENSETIVLTTGSVSSPYGLTVANSPQSLEISDNDNATLSISGATITEGNSGTATLSFTVTLDKDTGSPFTVDYTTADGTATVSDNDYTAANGTLSFNGTAGTRTIEVTVKGDQKVEPNESLSIALSNLSSSFGGRLSIPVAGSSATGTINNDDSGVITITSTDGMEAGPVAGTFTFSFPAGVTMDAPTTINYTLSGTAESGDDYTGAIGASVTIPVNTNSVTLALPVLQDLVVEDTETVILTTGIISSPYTVTVANSPQSLNIIDKDQAVVSLTGPATITEGHNGTQLATYTVTLNQATTGSFTVDYATANGTASLTDSDYESSSGRLTFAGAAGETETFTVEINGDQKIEADENFSVKLSNLISSFSNSPVVQSAPVVTSIENDDSGVITITSSNGSETGPVPGTFTFSFPAGASSDAATTIYLGLTGTALGTDYTGAGTSSVTIPAGDNSVTVSLPVIDDALAENTETVILTTGAVTSPYPITIANSPHSLDIADNDNATISISGASITEGNRGTATLSFTVTLDKDTGSPFTVDYATVDGTATIPDNDYISQSGTLTFTGTAGSQTIVVSLKGDQKVELNETFSITLSNLSSNFDNRLSIPVAGSTATGTINNDDSGAITISHTDGAEAGSVPGTFTFSFPAGVTMDAPTTINYTLSGTAESAKDYAEAISGSVTIPAMQNSIGLSLTVTDDAVVEDTETIILTTGTITSPYSITVANSPQSLNIIDNDGAKVTLTGQPTITEGDNGTKLVTYTATLDKATQGSFTVDYATANGTATIADDDYESSSGTLTFAGTAGETETFTVVINGDQKLEASENFNVALSNLASTFSNRPVAQTTAVVTSIGNDDDDLGVITITSANGSETGPVSGTFTFSFPTGVSADAPTIINFGLSGTATAVDYTGSGTASITIPTGDNSVTLTLPVIDDALVEGAESIVLTTGTVSSPYGITVTNSPHTLTIADNDNATLVIAGETKSEGDAGNKVLNFTVTLDKETGAPFTVDYVTSDGTATASDNDYIVKSGTLSFNGAAGESRIIAVSVIGDKKIEATESFTLALSNLSDSYNNTLVINGSPATGIISNDDTGIITVTPGNGSETGPVAGTFTFSFPAGMTMDAPTTVNYSLSGTAESAKDYTGAISGSITIPKDENSFTLTLPVTDDSVIEDTETIILSTGVLTSPYALTVANSPQSLTITDNDQAIVTLTEQPTITEGNSGTQLITYTATLDKASQGSFTVDYATANGTATLVDNDYESASGTLIFAGTAGETKTFTVQVNGDQKIEADENFSVSLSNLISSFSNRPLVQSTPVVTSIENDDSGVITITSGNGSETGSVSGTFTFSFPAGVTVDAATTINFALSGTATAADYTGAGTSSIIIPADDNSITLTLPVVNDLITEGTETIILATGTVSSPYGITVANSPQSLDIADNDNASLSISGTTVTEGNSGTAAMSFTVTLDKATGPFSLNYATADGTATTATNDYVARSGTLNFLGTAGESQTITVTITGDGKVEADETLNMTISDLSDTFDSRLIIATNTATGTITNDDSGVITITSTDGMEAGPVAGTFTFSLPAGVTMDAPTTINYTLSGTAESGNDYTGAISGSVTIPVNTNSIALTLPVLQDLVVEDTETVILTTGIISSPYTVAVGNSPKSLNIIDKDKAVVSLTGPATITEGHNGITLATYTVTLSQATAGSFKVDYATANGTATLADNDYESSSGTLEFAGTAGETETFTVQINGDKKIEAGENFSVTLSNLISSFSNNPLVQSTPVLTSIENDDSGAITITSSSGSETGPVPGTFTFSFPAGITSDAATTIYFGLTGTATGADYTGAGTLSATIPANANSAELSLGVTDDLIVEGTETVILTTGAISSPYPIAVANSPQSLTIADNDNATLSLTGGTATEGDSGTKVINFTVTLDKAASPFSVNYATADGTATIADNDYNALSGTLNFSGTVGETKTVAVTITGDKKIEADESFTMTLNNLSDHYNNALVIDGSPAMGIIGNDDTGLITVTPANGSEAGTVAGTFVFSLPAGTTVDAALTINYTLSGTAESAKDYTGAISGSVTIAKDAGSTTLTLPVIDDALVEDTETIILSTGIVNSPYNFIAVSNSPQSLNITDNDEATVTLTGPSTITEGNGGTQTATYNVTLDKATTGPFTINYTTSDGTASSTTNDYGVSSGSLTFAGTAGESKSITVQLYGDQKIELDETFSVSLSNLSNHFSNRLSLQTQPVVTNIENDDSGVITITSENGSETGQVPGSFSFSFPTGVSSDAETTINFGLSGTATGVDYIGAGTMSVTIPAGDNTVMLSLPVIDDALVESIETVVLSTSGVSSPYGITVANSPQSFNIADNDNASLSIAGATITEGNNGTRVMNFTVTLDKGTSPFNIDYKTKDGTATIADNDYAAANGTLNFAGLVGESKTIAISITGDKKIEANESLTLELSNLSNNFDDALVVSGSPATGVIIDDDNIPDNKKLAITTVNGAEGGANASMKFSFPDGVTSDGITSIPYTLAGTAQDNGTDYNISSTGILYIPAGENSIELPLFISDDPFIEGAETVIVSAGNITHDKYTGFTLANAPQTLYIADNDAALLSIGGPVTIVEGNNGSKKVVFNVALDKATGSGFSINYSTADGTALASDNDYIPVTNGTLVFDGKAGEVQAIEVSIIGDKKIELDENYQIRLTGLSSDFGGGLTFANTSAIGTIIDDDNDDTNKEITITKSDGTEGAADGSFTFSFPAGITLDAATTINYTLSGTAKGAGIDYNNSQVGAVVIPAGQNFAILTIDVVDDAGLEPSETVIISTGAVTNSNYNNLVVLNSPHTLNIEDDDNASLSISGPIQVTEGNAGTINAIFRVTLNNSTGDPFTVDYTTKDGTATIADNDYIASAGTLTFSGKSGEFVNITIPVKGDLKIEKAERFTVELSGLSKDFDQRLIINGTPAIGVIRDDDYTATNRRIIISKVNGSEGGNDASYKFSFQTGVSTDDWTTLNYSLSGTALGDGADYAAASNGSVTIPPGENSVVLDLSIIDDAVIEPIETVVLTVATIENNSYSGLTVNSTKVSLNINDNDEGEIKLSGPVLVQEGNSGPTLATFSVTLLGATASPFSIGYSTFDGTAKIADNDYVKKSANLSFQGVQGEVQTITILVNGDFKIENDEEFNLILRNLSNTFGDKLKFSGLPAKGRILNDDNGTIIITKTDGKEGANGGTFTFSLSAGVYSDKPIIVPYHLSGTAQANTVDYLVNSSGSVTIPAGLNKTDLNLVINDDSIIEPAETVKIATGIVLSSMPNAVLVENSPVELIIDDNDAAPITITNPVITKEGNSGYVTAVFSATLPLATAEGFTLDYATADETATTSDNDYTALTGRLTFAGRAGEVQTISVRVQGDVKVEGDEKYTISLTNLSKTFEGRLTIDFPTATGVIHDDDIAPTAISDFATTPEDTPVTFSLVDNDTDPQGIDPTSITIKTLPLKGEVKVNRDGTVTYSPAPDDNGMHHFTYTVKDLTGLESNEANVTVTVTPVSDPPIAEDDSFYVLRDGTLRENVSTNDADPDGETIRFKVTVPPSKGSLVSFNETDGSFVYTPTTENFTGFDQFTYQVTDAGGLTDDAVVSLGIQPKTKAKLSPTLVSVNEGEVVKITAEISEPLLQDVNLVLEYNGDAELGKDYKLEGNFTSFLIKAGETTATGEILLVTTRDYVKEGEEVAEVNIASATPGPFVEIESGSEVTITELTPAKRPLGPDENDDIIPDPYTSPNGDGLGNEGFVIHNISKYPDNEVVIFNRWGNEVFRVKGYDNTEKVFKGVANAGVFVNKDTILPDGVYYFIIHTKMDAVAKMNKGYVIIKR